jgi:hypothetical protein
MKLSSLHPTVAAMQATPKQPIAPHQRAGSLHVPKPYVNEVSTLLYRVASDVNQLQNTSVHNKLVFAQHLAGPTYYKAENKPERDAVAGLIPHLNSLKAQVVQTPQATNRGEMPISEVTLEFLPTKGWFRSPKLKSAGIQLQQHVEGWVSQHARAIGIPHYLKR